MSVRAQLLSFAGRVGRKRFWLVFLGVIGTFLATAFPSSLLARTGTVGSVVANIFMFVVLVLGAWISAANQVKRWHDLGRSGWMILICFIPVLGFVANVICLGFVPGRREPNRFGPPPDAADPVLPPADQAAPPRVAPAEPPRIAPPAPAPSPRRWRLAVLGLVGVLVVMPLLAALYYFITPGEKMGAQRDWVRATLGSAEASHRMGWRCRDGKGEAQDFSAAAGWFERAAKKGLPKAQYDLGVMHFYGLGVPADSAKAVGWLEQAAAQNYAPARTLLGVIAARSGDMGRAMACWLAAADLGDAYAESLLGSAYLAHRDDGDENIILALYWMETARRDGVEPVEGQLQHIWATVPEDRLDRVTNEVFRRIEAGSPEPLVPAVPAPPASETPAPETPEQVTTTADPAPAGLEELSALVLERVQQHDEYVTLKALFALRSLEDQAWANSEDGTAVGAFIDEMQADAGAVHLQRADDGTETLAYAIQGTEQTYPDVQIDRLRTDGKYQSLVIDELARNIASAPKPLRVAELLRAFREEKGGTAQ